VIRNPGISFFVFLAITALAIASRGFAQQSNGSPDGLYTLPDAGRSTSSAQQLTSDRSAQSFLGALDPRDERFKRDLEKAEATRQAIASTKRLRYLAANGDSVSSSWTPGLAERTWIAILAVGGILLSLTAGGYVWWSRALSTRNHAILLNVKPEPTAKQNTPHERRAA